MRHGRWMVAALLLAACQPSGGGGGKGYDPQNQPAVNPYATPDSMMGGGRVPQVTGGPNAGTYGVTPPAGTRGSGSRYYPYPGTPSASPSR